jgi:hypothetical protein
MESSGDPAVLLTDLLPSSSSTTWPSTRTVALVGSTIVVLSAVEVGWWWLQRYRFLQYRREHPNTVFLTPYKHRPTKWGQVAAVILRVAWTILVVTMFGCYVTAGFVLMRGAGRGLRCAQSYLTSLLEMPRAKCASWKTVNRDEQPQAVTASSTFVLAPILRSKPGASAASATVEPSTGKQGAHGGAKKGVTFEEHSNGQIRHKQVSFDPASASSFSVEDSRTPPPHSEPLTQQPRQRTQARMPQTPPLPRRGRHAHSQTHSNKENVRTNSSGMQRASALVERGGAQAPTTPQNLREVDILSAKVSRPVIPPFPGASPHLTESIRKRRAAAAVPSSNDFSPAVKRMYGRLRLPASSTSASQHPHHYTSLLVARQLKRRRDNDRLVWEAFNCAPTAAKKSTVQAPEPSTASASAVPPPTAAFQPGSSAEPASNLNVADAAATTALFGFGTPPTTVTAPPAAADPSSTGQMPAPTTVTGGTAAPTPPPFQFGSVNRASHKDEGPRGGDTRAVPSGGATANREQPVATASTEQPGSSLSTPEVAATPQQAPPAGPAFSFGVAPTTAQGETTAPSLNAPFQGAPSSGATEPADRKASLDGDVHASMAPPFAFGNGQSVSPATGPNFPVDPTPSLKIAAAQTATPAGPATMWPASVPAPLAAATTTFQFGSGIQHPQPAITSVAPPVAFGAAHSNTPNPAPLSTGAPAGAPAPLFGAQPKEIGGGVGPAPAFFDPNRANTPGSMGAAVSGAPAGGFGFGPANNSTPSVASFAFSSGAAQPGFSSAVAQPGFGPGAAQPGFGSGAAQPGFGSGAAQPGFGSGAAQPGFGSAAAPPGGAAYPFGSSAAYGTSAPTYGAASGTAARPSSRTRPKRPPRRPRN